MYRIPSAGSSPVPGTHRTPGAPGPVIFPVCLTCGRFSRPCICRNCVLTDLRHGTHATPWRSWGELARAGGES
jgi:hypothetical protein